LILHMLTVGSLGTNCYLVGCPQTNEAAVVDPGGDADLILGEARRLGLKITQIILTHGHFDHIAALRAVHEATGAPIAIHPADAPMLTNPLRSFAFWMGSLQPCPPADVLLNAGDVVRLGRTVQLSVRHVPGHSPGGIALVATGVVFSGDALFAGSIGRTDFPGGSYRQLIASIQSQLLTLPDDTVVYPGHGPLTTIGEERRYNPFLQSEQPELG